MEGQMVSLKEKRTQKDYSLPFKLQVILEVEKGELSYKEAQRKYGIEGRSTVLVWLRKHGSLDWQTHNPMKGKQTPQQEIRELQKKLKRMEMKNEILEKAIEIADEHLGTDIRKKYLDLLLKTSGQQADEASQLDL
jgi:transposase-like protein